MLPGQVPFKSPAQLPFEQNQTLSDCGYEWLQILRPTPLAHTDAFAGVAATFGLLSFHLGQLMHIGFGQGLQRNSELSPVVFGDH